MCCLNSRSVSVFQSTPPHGRRPGRGRLFRFGVERFNPRLRTGGDAYNEAKMGLDLEFQSTPPHGRRPMPASKTPPSAVVSIHASAREAT